MLEQDAIRSYDAQGNLIGTVMVDVPAEETNQRIANQNLQAQAQAAIVQLRAFRAKATPTNAEVVAVVKLLCLCMIQLIRLVARKFDEVD